MSEPQTSLVLAEPVAESRALMPMAMGKTFAAYKAMQSDIDKAMPDQIMTIQGRQFRKKGYWRAVRAAFGLKVECVREERIVRGDEWGYSALYRAEGSNGMSADGDGVCMASEKRGGQGTEHNVRSHAHTRAFNRAVSNLVGFGEVSAEEVERDDEHHVQPSRPVAPTPAVVKPNLPIVDVQAEPPDMGPDHDVADAQPDQGFVYVTQVKKIKEGSTARGPWKLFGIALSDNRGGTTFDTNLALNAETYMTDKTPVIPTLKEDAKNPGKWNLTGLVRAV